MVANATRSDTLLDQMSLNTAILTKEALDHSLVFKTTGF